MTGIRLTVVGRTRIILATSVHEIAYKATYEAAQEAQNLHKPGQVRFGLLYVSLDDALVAEELMKSKCKVCPAVLLLSKPILKRHCAIGLLPTENHGGTAKRAGIVYAASNSLLGSFIGRNETIRLV